MSSERWQERGDTAEPDKGHYYVNSVGRVNFLLNLRSNAWLIGCIGQECCVEQRD